MARVGVVLGSGASDLQAAGAAILRRHGDGRYVLPHEIDHVANLRRLIDAGCDRVLALGSVGALRRELAPGTLLCPDDFIALDVRPLTALEGHAAHRVPGFDADWRREVLAAFAPTGVQVHDGGVYWQVSGPRLETPAEVRLAASHADVIGMTIASECVIAGELGLRYAAICMVDNLANGVAATELTLAEVETHRARNRVALQDVLTAALPELLG